MPVMMVDDLEVNYETGGLGAPLLMMAPGGFDATIDKWLTTNAWKGINALEKLASEYQVIVYDRRESGRSGGRVEKLRWELYAQQAKGLLDHLKIDSAFVREKELTGVVERAKEKASFWQDSESGPWAPCIARDEKFAAAFKSQDQERYLGIVEASGRALFDRDTAPGAEPEEIFGIKAPALIVPGDDPSHATSAAHYLRECLPKPEFWNVMPPEQSTERVCDRILEFCRNN